MGPTKINKIETAEIIFLRNVIDNKTFDNIKIRTLEKNKNNNLIIKMNNFRN